MIMKNQDLKISIEKTLIERRVRKTSENKVINTRNSKNKETQEIMKDMDIIKNNSSI